MKLNLLLIANFDPSGLLTIKENIINLQKFSKHTISICNLFPNFECQSNIDCNEFDGIIIHNTLAYFPDTVNKIEKILNLDLKNYPGLKVLMKQDEHIRSWQTADMIGEKKFDLVLTCLPENEIEKVYPTEKTSGAKFLTHLTGYITDSLISQNKNIDYNRCIDISYRGSIQPLQCGRLGYEKWNIGHSVNNSLKNQTISLDISSEWSSRIYGSDWLKFLQCSKATLGVESGSNLFDLSGEVEKQCNHFEKANASLIKSPARYYQAAQQEFLEQYEDNVYYAQVSPRHFEAAATRTLQILYEGSYSNIFLEKRHFLPLKRDLSNLEEILFVVHNAKLRKEITDCAFEEIVLNTKYHLASFVSRFDEALEEIAISKSIKPKTYAKRQDSKSNILVLVPHEIHLDPRIRWLEKGLSEFSNVVCIGVNNKDKQVHYSLDPKQPNHIHANLASMDCQSAAYLMEDIDKEFFSFQQKLYQFINDKKTAFCPNGILGQEDIKRHRSYCEFFIKVDKAIERTVFNLIKKNQIIPDCIICCDLPSLLPGVVVSQYYNIPLVYDAHEFWAYSDVRYKPWETEFWLNFERTLLNYVDVPVTVSEGLAQNMKSSYRKEFMCVPNAELKKDHINVKKIKKMAFIQKSSSHQIVFLYQGAFAQGRGLEKLIFAWRKVSKNCLLYLRGPENEYSRGLKAYAQKNDLLDRVVFFLPPVKECELVEAASQADVGIIPYDANTSILYKHCCPNKLSQYMAASLPIISNKLEEIAGVIHKAQCGYSEEFDCENDLIRRVHQLAESKELRHNLGQNARNFFLENFHWEKLSYPLYTKINELRYTNGKHVNSRTMFLKYLLADNNVLTVDPIYNIAIDLKQLDYEQEKHVRKVLLSLYASSQWIRVLYRHIVPNKIRKSIRNRLSIP